MPPNFNTTELVKISIRNLAKLLDGNISVAQTESGLHGFLADENHVAAILLLDPYWGFARNRVNDDVVVGVPAKDLLFFVPASDETLIAELKKTVSEVHKSGEKLLSKALFKYSGSGLEIYNL